MGCVWGSFPVVTRVRKRLVFSDRFGCHFSSCLFNQILWYNQTAASGDEEDVVSHLLPVKVESCAFGDAFVVYDVSSSSCGVGVGDDYCFPCYSFQWIRWMREMCSLEHHLLHAVPRCTYPLRRETDHTSRCQARDSRDETWLLHNLSGLYDTGIDMEGSDSPGICCTMKKEKEQRVWKEGNKSEWKRAFPPFFDGSDNRRTDFRCSWRQSNHFYVPLKSRLTKEHIDTHTLSSWVYSMNPFCSQAPSSSFPFRFPSRCSTLSSLFSHKTKSPLTLSLHRESPPSVHLELFSLSTLFYHLSFLLDACLEGYFLCDGSKSLPAIYRSFWCVYLKIVPGFPGNRSTSTNGGRRLRVLCVWNSVSSLTGEGERRRREHEMSGRRSLRRQEQEASNCHRNRKQQWLSSCIPCPSR